MHLGTHLFFHVFIHSLIHSLVYVVIWYLILKNKISTWELKFHTRYHIGYFTSVKIIEKHIKEHTIPQIQKAVTAYLKSKQLLHFDFGVTAF